MLSSLIFGVLYKKMYLCGMIKTLVISLPMLICIFWSVLLLLDWWEQRTHAKARMVFFMLTATILYGCHFVFFNHLYGWMPVIDAIYCMANLSVFPLYYLYIKEVTDEQKRRHWQVTLLIPALLAGLTTGALYLFMDEPSNFLDRRLPMRAPMNVPIAVNAATSSMISPLRKKIIAPENAVMPIM